jgi:Domain of unknown function (DUF4129)
MDIIYYDQRRRGPAGLRLGRRCAGVILTAIVIAGPAVCARAGPPVLSATTPPPAGRWRDVSMDDYRKHLTALSALVDACAKARDLKSCDPLLVGPDDRIPLNDGATTERRLVRYGWLRVLFSKAEEPDEAPAAPDRSTKGKSAKDSAPPAPVTTSQLLRQAQLRLAFDLAQADVASGAAPVHVAERDAMKRILAGRDFRNLEQPTVRDSILEKVGNWLNRVFESMTRWRARSAWIGRLLVWGFILGVCIALVWGLLQLERKWRVRLVPEERAFAAGAPSSRDWQLWLDDARRAAASGHWREAIHFVYWAAISRLESKRMWPADRARTPREYLALVAAEDPRRSGLATLTGSFERTWYGGRAAGEGDYRRAEEIASALIAGGSTKDAAEGGAR